LFPFPPSYATGYRGVTSEGKVEHLPREPLIRGCKIQLILAKKIEAMNLCYTPDWVTCIKYLVVCKNASMA